MTKEVLILHDPASILRGYLDKLTARLRAFGIRRIPKGGSD